MRYFVSAGEASGDLHAAPLMAELRSKDPEAQFTFLGGDFMAEAAGHAPLIHYRDMAFMGFYQVARNLPKVLGNLRTAREALRRERPDALILVDYPSFNMKLAKDAYQMGIPVYWYIAPKVWAWKEWRVKKIRQYCTKVLSILPFEIEYFKSKGLKEGQVEYVGNPSLAEVDQKLRQLPPREEFLNDNRLSSEKPLLALVPGSRMSEIRSNLPLMAEAARRFPQLQPVVAGAPGIDPKVYETFTDFPVVIGQTFELMHASTVALVTSGTATLECALIGTPQAVCYRNNGSRLSYNLLKRLIHCPFVSLPNLIAGHEAVRELLMHLCTPDAMASEIARLLPGSTDREAMLRDYVSIRSALGSSCAPQKAATSILKAFPERRKG